MVKIVVNNVMMGIILIKNQNYAKNVKIIVLNVQEMVKIVLHVH